MPLPILIAVIEPTVVAGGLVLLAGAAVAPLLARARGRRRDGAAADADAPRQLERERKRAAVLEAIIASSARLNATRQLPELIDGTVAAFAEVAGCRRVLFYLWSDHAGGFLLRGAHGVPASESAELGRRTVTSQEFDRQGTGCAANPGCGLVPGPAEAKQCGEGAWPGGCRLRIPLLASDGSPLGFMDIEQPLGGRRPEPEDRRNLTFLARQAAAAIESVRTNERLAANNAELAHAARKLDSLSDMKANFVANVSHELRTPLTSISAYAEMLQQNLETMPTASLGEFLKVIRTESDKLTTVINDILELGQMEKGKVTERAAAELDLAGLVRRLQDGWQGRAAERGQQLAVNLPEGPLPLTFDPVLMQQLLTHLVSNACKFTPEGGRVTVGLQESGSAVRLTVEDTGIGIPADELGAIFDKFYQVDGSATREHNGQGVGLAICHQIVTHHDGRIWAENRPGGGARFTVLLPRRAPVVQAAPAEAQAGRPFAPGEFQQRLLHWLAESLGVQTVTLMEPDPDGEHLAISAAIGLSEAVVQGARVRRGAGIAGRVWATGRSVRVDDITREKRFGRDANEPRFSTASVLCVPLPGQAGVAGVVTVNNRFDGRPLDDTDRQFLEALAPLIAGMLERHGAWRAASARMAALRESLRVTTAVGHLRQGSLLRLCQEIALAVAGDGGLSADERRQLAFALPFYDVGMGTVPPQLLNKPEPLAPEDQEIMRRHVAASLEILDALEPEPGARRIVLHHHENFNGSGYPAGLAGEAIPAGARLLRLADSLAALLSPRPWRPAFGLDDALEHLAAGLGAEYCPQLGPTFIIEVLRRRERIEVLQLAGADARDLARPVLDRRGITSGQ